MSERTDFINGLRDLADFYEARPELQLPQSMLADIWYHRGETPIEEVARQMGKAEKVDADNLFILRRNFGPIRLDANFYREDVCERIVTGTTLVEEPIMVPAGTHIVEKEVVEWKCPKIFDKALDKIPVAE